MTGLWSFFVYEMRRNLPVLPVGLVAVGILMLPPVRQLGSDFGVDDWRLLAAVCVLVLLMPALAIYLASNAWLRERSEGTLQWLYARPLSGGALFAVRLTAIVVSLALFAALGCVLLGVSPLVLLDDPVLFELGAGPLFTLLIVVVPAAAIWASACSPGQGWSAPLLFGVVVAAWLLPTIVPGMLPVPVALYEYQTELEGAVGWLRYLVYPLLLLSAAWWAARRAVLDRRPRRQAILGSGVAAVLATLLLVLLGSAAAWIEPARVTLVRELAGGKTLRYVEGKGLKEGLARVEVTGVGRLPVFTGSMPFVAPGGQATLIPGVNNRSGGTLVGHTGTLRELPKLGDRAVGWSPGGQRFAFLCSPRVRTRGVACGDSGVTVLTITDRDGGIRTLPVPALDPDGVWQGAWVDGEHLALVERAPVVPGEHEKGPRWGVLSIGGRVARWVRPLAALGAGERLSTAFEGWPELLHGYPVPRRDGRLLLWHESGEKRALVALDPHSWSLEPLAVRSRDAVAAEKWYHPETLGTLEDGTVVWVERAAGAYRVMVLPSEAAGQGAEVRSSCRLPAEPRPYRFLGSVGRRAVWGGGKRLIGCDLDDDMADAGDELGDGLLAFRGVDVTEQGILVPPE